MRPIPLRLVLAVIVAVLCLAWVGPSAGAVSFPCGSFVHQLRHGKLHDTIQGEGVVSQQVARFKKGVARDEASNLPEPTKTGKINSDKRKLTEWTAHLRYLKALDARIGQENCSRFNYRGVIAWIKHRSGHLHADRFKLAGDPSVNAGMRIAYDTGGLEALDPAGVRIKEIAARHGVRIAAAADAPMPGVPGPPAPPFGAEYAVPVVMQVFHVEPRQISFNGGIPAYNEPVTTEIQYGPPTTAYGQTSKPYQPPMGVSVGLNPVVFDLAPATTYHWRFAVLKASGNVYTPDATVTTLADPMAASHSSKPARQKPHQAQAKRRRSAVRINANPAVAQLVKLHDKGEQFAGSHLDPASTSLAGDIVIGTYARYRQIATAEKVVPSSAPLFDAIGLPLSKRAPTKNTPIAVGALMSQLKRLHCHLTKKYHKVSASFSASFYPIIKGLYNAENKALKRAGKPKLKVPSKSGIC